MAAIALMKTIDAVDWTERKNENLHFVKKYCFQICHTHIGWYRIRANHEQLLSLLFTCHSVILLSALLYPIQN